MSNQICLVVPEAPMLAPVVAGGQRELRRASLRIGMLDNSKGNADHLLRFIAEGIKAALPVHSIVTLRKATVGSGAPAAMLQQLVDEADFVFSAMAD